MMSQKKPTRNYGRGFAIVSKEEAVALLVRFEAGENLRVLSTEVGVSRAALSQRFTKIRNGPQRAIEKLEARIADLEAENATLKARLRPGRSGETRSALVDVLMEKNFQTFEDLASAINSTEKRVRACVYAHQRLFEALKGTDGIVYVRMI